MSSPQPSPRRPSSSANNYPIESSSPSSSALAPTQGGFDLDAQFPDDEIATYRHLLSPQTLVPSNPLRVITLCDVDAAYAQFEGVRLGLDKTVPIAVQQWQGLIAVNYPARAFGISRHENIDIARKKCPHIIACHVATLKDGEDEPKYHENPDSRTHKVSLEPYRKESSKIIKIFQRECPTGEIERASIDEAYIDLTLPVRNLLLSRYPYLQTVPPDSPLGLDTPLPPAPHLDWENCAWNFNPSPPPDTLTTPVSSHAPSSSTVAASASKSKGKERERPIREGNWADVALWVGGELMEGIREAVERDLGYTTSAGIAHNKILAKLCAGHRKPRAQTVLHTASVAAFLRPLRFQKIRLLGGKLGEAIAAEYEANTVGDLLTVGLDEIQVKFGEEALWIHNVIRGVDHTEVKQKSLVKSMLASKNMRPAITSLESGQGWLRVLCVELIGRLKDARGGEDEERVDIWPKTLVLSWRVAGQNYSQNQSKQIPFPFHRPLTPDGPILKLSSKLLVEVLAPNSGMSKGKRPVINIINLSLGFTGLERGEEGQRGIEGFFKPKGKLEESAGTGVAVKKEKSEGAGGLEGEVEREGVSGKRKREGEGPGDKKDLKGKGKKKAGIGSYFLPAYNNNPSISSTPSATSITRPIISRSSSSSSSAVDNSPSILSPSKKEHKTTMTRPSRHDSNDTNMTDTTPISLLSDDDDDTPTPKRSHPSALPPASTLTPGPSSFQHKASASKPSPCSRPSLDPKGSSSSTTTPTTLTSHQTKPKPPRLPPPSPKPSSKPCSTSSSSTTAYWTCPNCSKRFLLSSSLPSSSSSPNVQAEAEERALVDERVRTEHLDFHLAMELQEQAGSGSGSGGIRAGGSGGGKRKEKKQEKEKEQEKISSAGGRGTGKKKKEGGSGGLGDWLVRKKS